MNEVCNMNYVFYERGFVLAGRVPKIQMLKPEFVITITYELIRLLVKRAIGSKVKSRADKEIKVE